MCYGRIQMWKITKDFWKLNNGENFNNGGTLKWNAESPWAVPGLSESSPSKVLHCCNFLLHWWSYVWLTDWSKLEICNFACLTVLALPLLYSIQSGQSSHPDQSGQHSQFGQPYQCDYPGQYGDQTVVTLVSLFSLVTPVNLVIPIRLVTLVTLCKICTLHNFQFYLAHLWTDFQSCCSKWNESVTNWRRVPKNILILSYPPNTRKTWIFEEKKFNWLSGICPFTPNLIHIWVKCNHLQLATSCAL